MTGFPELVLFAVDPRLVERALGAGITSCISDWEQRGKEERQLGADTEINHEGPDDLARLSRLGVPRRFCRLDRPGHWTPRQIELALEAGATHLLLPMVESPDEVRAFVARIAGRASAGILLETAAALEAAPDLAGEPIDRVYIGLNDLAISRRSRSLFEPFLDGTLDRLRPMFEHVAFGVAGLTLADRGEPVPCRLLMSEMVRLRVDFTFLRRSFRRDVAGSAMDLAVDGMRALWRRLEERDDSGVARDQLEFRAAVEAAWTAQR